MKNADDGIVYKSVEKMKAENQAISGFFERKCKKIQKVSEKVKKRY